MVKEEKMRRTKRFWHFLSLGLTAVLLATLLGACGDSPTATPAVTTLAATTATGTTVATTTVAATSAVSADKAIPAFPAKPVTIQVFDVCGCDKISKAILTNYQKANPDKVVNIEYPPRGQAPELAGKIKAQQDAGKLDIALVFSGYDGMAAGVEQGLWLSLNDYNSKFSSLTDNYLDQAKQAAKIAQGFAYPFAYTPGGPLFEYDPGKIKSLPKNPDELKAWVKANPNKFLYAQPTNSGPGRTFLMGLPYLLGDKDPKDPINGWDKTWAYLKELDQSIEYYPTGTGAMMKELGEGTRWLVPTTMGWDINSLFLNTFPSTTKTFMLENTTFVSDALFMMIPKNLDNDRLAVVLDIIAFTLKPEQQANAYDEGYFYPGPAIKGVDISLAPPHSQDVIKQFGRPEYPEMIKKVPTEMPLDTKLLVAAYAKWDKEIGGNKLKK